MLRYSNAFSSSPATACCSRPGILTGSPAGDHAGDAAARIAPGARLPRARVRPRGLHWITSPALAARVTSPWDRQRAIAIGLLASLALWHLPFGGVVLYPFKLLATWMHELSHGLVMIAVGAGFDRMEIYRDTSGLAFAQAGASRVGRAAIAAAGYMGTPVCGAVLLVLGQTGRSARRLLAGLAVLMAASTAIWIHNDFGRVAMGVIAAALLAIALVPGRRVAVWLASFVAAQACINALLDIRVLFRANLVVDGQVMRSSDAHDMAAACGGTTELWAAVWLVWSLALLYAALRIIHLRQTRPAAPAPPT